jgi:hypothetical protein
MMRAKFQQLIRTRRKYFQGNQANVYFSAWLGAPIFLAALVSRPFQN